MKKLLEFLLKNILGETEFSVNEETDGNFVNYTLKTKPENIGFIIGKGGTTIKAIRNLLRVRAIFEKKVVSVSVSE